MESIGLQDIRTGHDIRPVVVHNPNSTNSSLIDQVIGQISQDPRWSPPELIETKSPDAMANAHAIAEQLEPDTAAWVVGGDGLMMSAVNAVNLNPALRDSVCLVPVPAGNACDTSRSLYGTNIAASGRFLDIMSRGEPFAMNCIETRVNGVSRLAASYAGFNCTAEISRLFGSDDWRSRRPNVPLWPPGVQRLASNCLADARDAAAILRLFRDNQPFSYREYLDTGDGAGVQPHTFEAHDILYNNLPYFAKAMRAAADVAGGSTMIEFPAAIYRRQLIQVIGQALMHGMQGMPTYERRLIIASKSVRMHTDGECLELRAGDEVVVRDKPAAATIVLPL